MTKSLSIFLLSLLLLVSSSVVRADDVFPSPPATRSRLLARTTVDLTSVDAVNFADVTGLTFTIVPNTTYGFACELTYTTAIGTTALHLTLNGPAAPTNLRYSVRTGVAASSDFLDVQSAYETVNTPVTSGGAVDLPARVNGILENGVNPGTLALRFKTSVGASAVNILRGSFCVFQAF